MLWAGQHNIVAPKPIQDDLVVEDIITVPVMMSSGVANLNAMAISGGWIVGFSGEVGQPWELSLVNINSHSRYDLGTDPTDAPVFPLGNQGRFLVTPSSGAAYMIDSARINGGSN